MTDITAPYDLSALQQIAQSLETTYSLTLTTRTGTVIAPLELAGNGLDFALDEAWTPYAQLQANVIGLEDMSIIDPRKGHRIVLELGYKYTGGTIDQHVVADLVLAEWTTKFDGTFDITAHSDERLLQEWESLGVSVTYPSGTQAVNVIFSELQRTLGVSALVTAVRDTDITEPIIIGTGVNRWDVMRSLADQADIWVYCDALRNWIIADRPSKLTAPVAQLTTGPNGVVVDREMRLSRDTWGNTAVIEYSDKRFGYASRSAGEMGTDNVGVCAYRISIDAPYPGSVRANQAANALLRRVLSRGESKSLTALAAWWVAPGDTVTDPDTERLLVSSVRFTFPDSLMQVKTRTIEDEI